MFGGAWKVSLSFLTSGVRRGGRRRRSVSFRPGLESLEDRRVPANLGSVSGHVLIDQTGNGASLDDTAHAGVKVNLFQDSNGNGVLDGTDHQLAYKYTGADGSYSFNNLAAGHYFVTESVPSGFVRTGPTLSSSYAINLADGQAATGNDFDNFQKPATSPVTNVSFTVLDGGTTKTVTNLRGQTHQGDQVTANFTITGTVPVVVSLIAYDAPGPAFDANTASQQVPVEIETATFAPGPHTLSVQLPPNYYQVDFVVGAAISQLGPAGSNIFYSAQGRLLSADNGGTNPVAPPSASLSGFVYNSSDFSGLANVTVALTYTNNQGQTVTVFTMTGSDGSYSFTGLAPGTYTLQVGPSPLYQDQGANSGSLGGSATAGTISSIVLHAGDNGTAYDFTEYVPPTS